MQPKDQALPGVTPSSNKMASDPTSGVMSSCTSPSRAFPVLFKIPRAVVYHLPRRVLEGLTVNSIHSEGECYFKNFHNLIIQIDCVLKLPHSD